MGQMFMDGSKKCPVKEKANSPSSRKMSPIMMNLRCYSPTGMLLVYIGVYPFIYYMEFCFNAYVIKRR